MPAILEVDNVTKSFGGVRAVDGASFRLAAPGIYGLIGPNGAGKTTLFDVICGRQFADTGNVRLAGERIDHLRVHQRARLGLGAHLPGMPRPRSGNLPRQCAVCRTGQASRQRDSTGNQPPHRRPSDREPRKPSASSISSICGASLPNPPEICRSANGGCSKSFPASSLDRTCFCSTNPLPASIRRCSIRCTIFSSASLPNGSSLF